MSNDIEQLKKRIQRILGDDDFRAHCFRCKESNPNFENDLKIAEQIARFNPRIVYMDESLLRLGDRAFKPKEVEEAVLEFYIYLDSQTRDCEILADQVVSNRKYVVMRDEKTDRSYCSYRRDDDGTEERRIYINLEGRVGDTEVAIHEMCHSLSDAFMKGKPLRDRMMSEVCPVITDQLSNVYLMTKYPDLAKNFQTQAIHTQVQNIIKAREVLLDGLIIKIMTGDLKIEDVERQYGSMFLNNTNILERCLTNIENFRFTNMHEMRYLIPQAISLKILDIYNDDPQKAITIFKDILKNDTEYTIEDTLKLLQISSKQELIDDYVDNYENRILQMRVAEEGHELE